MLTARKIGDTLYLSCYNDFPENIGDIPLEGAGAKPGNDRGTKYNMAAVCALIRLHKKKRSHIIFKSPYFFLNIDDLFLCNITNIQNINQ